MKKIKDTVSVTLAYEKKELLDGEWLPYVRVSQKLRTLEKEQSLAYRALTTRLYNSYVGNRYNAKELYGFNCISVKDTMTREDSSLVIKFCEA